MYKEDYIHDLPLLSLQMSLNFVLISEVGQKVEILDEHTISHSFKEKYALQLYSIFPSTNFRNSNIQIYYAVSL